jgi:hypothetical protein
VNENGSATDTPRLNRRSSCRSLPSHGHLSPGRAAPTGRRSRESIVPMLGGRQPLGDLWQRPCGQTTATASAICGPRYPNRYQLAHYLQTHAQASHAPRHTQLAAPRQRLAAEQGRAPSPRRRSRAVPYGTTPMPPSRSAGFMMECAAAAWQDSVTRILTVSRARAR